MWEVLALEADTLPPELQGIAGDYGHRSESFSLSRRDDPGRDKINLRNGRVAALTRDGVRYELTPTAGPNAYEVIVKGTTYAVRIYHYCSGPPPALPQNARHIACPPMRSEKTPCSFSCDPGFELSDPSLHVGTIACTASGKLTANSSCVRPGAPHSAPAAPAAPSALAAPSAPANARATSPAASGADSNAWIAAVVLGLAFVGAAIFFLVKRRRR
jgi:LPXTG-motif cell wall-anchored protein